METTQARERVVPVPGFPAYRISDGGRLETCTVNGSGKPGDTWREMKVHKTPSGYLQVHLYQNSERRLFHVHTLVLLAFVGPRPEGHQACHGNGIRDDNRLENLRWDTVSANHADKHRHGTMRIGESHPRAKLDEGDVRAIRRRAKDGAEYSALAREYGLTAEAVRYAAIGRTWRHVS